VTEQAVDFNQCSYSVGPECSGEICVEVRKVVSTESDSLRGNQTDGPIPPTRCVVFTGL
jgi:hypothetical protein